MRKKLVLFCSIIFWIAASQAQVVQELKNIRPDSADIKELVDKYAQSINDADSGWLMDCSGRSAQNTSSIREDLNGDGGK